MRCLDRLRRSRRYNLLRRHRIALGLWQRICADALNGFRLDKRELHRLRILASVFLRAKTISGARGLTTTHYIRAVIAAQACLLILNLDLGYYDDGWSEIIVYPDSFIVTQQSRDDAGVVHQRRVALGGEAWGRGPVILAWDDARPDARPHGSGSNVILHEFAHKLDMLNGAANGMPPLHAAMHREDWTRVFSVAYEDLQRDLERYQHTDIDPYGAESPAEFFAVLSEEFFLAPRRLHHSHPDVYDQLALFYRQDPLARDG